MAQVKDGEIVEETEEIKEEITEIDEELEVDSEEETEEETDKEPEPWQLTDEDLDDVPVKTHIRVKQKLKGTISEKNEELERLKAENEALKAQKIAPTTLKRPKEEDFDDDESYQAAKDKYDDAVTQQRYDRIEAEKRQTAAQQQLQSKVNSAVEDHYTRADKLITESGIKPEIYKKADETVRLAVDSIIPEQGDSSVDWLISILGEGSEKVLYYLGNNKSALNEFKSLLVDDKTGMKAVMYLGQQKERLTNPQKRTSRAPAPTPKLKGDEVAGSNGKALKKAYAKAHKKGDSQGAWNARKAAKAAGVDVSTW